MILLSELYNKLKHYEYEGNSSVDSFYKDLRSYIKGGYLPIHGYLSDMKIAQSFADMKKNFDRNFR